MGRNSKRNTLSGYNIMSKNMRKHLRETGMSEEEVLEMESSSMSEIFSYVGLDSDDYDPTYDREVRLAIRENERKYF